jgi:hypothetical protein
MSRQIFLIWKVTTDENEATEADLKIISGFLFVFNRLKGEKSFDKKVISKDLMDQIKN